MKLQHDTYILQEDVQGFYDSVVTVGTTLYPFRIESSPVKHKGENHYRFIFDTIKGATADDVPIGNKRVGIWYTKGKFEIKLNHHE